MAPLPSYPPAAHAMIAATRWQEEACICAMPAAASVLAQIVSIPPALQVSRNAFILVRRNLRT